MERSPKRKKREEDSFYQADDIFGDTSGNFESFDFRDTNEAKLFTSTPARKVKLFENKQRKQTSIIGNRSSDESDIEGECSFKQKFCKERQLSDSSSSTDSTTDEHVHRIDKNSPTEIEGEIAQEVFVFKPQDKSASFSATKADTDDTCVSTDCHSEVQGEISLFLKRESHPTDSEDADDSASDEDEEDHSENKSSTKVESSRNKG